MVATRPLPVTPGRAPWSRRSVDRLIAPSHQRGSVKGGAPLRLRRGAVLQSASPPRLRASLACDADPGLRASTDEFGELRPSNSAELQPAYDTSPRRRRTMGIA